MSDDEYSSGLTGWAWHELGRQAERSQQVQRNAVSAFRSRLWGEEQVDVGDLISTNEALWQQNQKFTQRINELDLENWERYRDYCRLKEWANAAEAELIELRAEKRAREEKPFNPDLN